MITVRISFEKKNEASYISLLDLQRVMQRVLKRSGLPVWHTLGFNPHIYMTFACPLSLGQESECECVDVKTEAEAPDFAQWKTALNAIMPAGIVIYPGGPGADEGRPPLPTPATSITLPGGGCRSAGPVQRTGKRPGGKARQKGQQDH